MVNPDSPLGGGNWSVISGSTPSVKTGPSAGQGGTGKYIYYEATNVYTEGTRSRQVFFSIVFSNISDKWKLHAINVGMQPKCGLWPNVLNLKYITL